ncbi:M23 family metallopeptidase [Streptomyces sp. NPDC047002]|uniref:murein hydrolase activator EnvC family protein n=1 Tax=Streptomyces sp. NPDC047002 TaxID=3155475 RepID=UPI0034556525
MATLRLLLSAALLWACAAPAGAGAPAAPAAAPAPAARLLPPHGPAAGRRGGRSWPVAARPEVVRGWLPPPSAYGPGHRGADLAARAGDAVLAVADGRVSFAGRVAGRGVLSIVLAGTGAPPLRVTYEPVAALVARGEVVRAGQVVGRLAAGPFHCAAGCLHLGLLRGPAYLDPLALLPAPGPSRLLPLGPGPPDGGRTGEPGSPA